MRSLALLPVMGLIVVASPVTVWSQTAPTTQQQQQGPAARSPFRSAGDRRFDGRGFGADGMRPPRTEWRRGDVRPEYPAGGGGGGRGAEQQDYEEPTPEEWKEIEAFMKEHSPKRLERMGEIADDERQEAVKRMLVVRYRAMQELKEQDAELYKIRLQRMPVEDEVFALGWELTHVRNDKAEDVRNELRKNLRLLFKSGLKERAHRLKHWEKVLEQHRQKLKEDEAKLESAVEGYMTDVQEERWPRYLRPQQQQRRQRGAYDDDAGEVSPREGGVEE